MYYCALGTCPNNKIWPLYCILCNDDEPPKHEHRAKTIAIKGESVKDEWHKLRAKINESLSKTKNWFGLHGDLVKILSDPEYHGNDQMLKDQQALIQLNANMNLYFTKEINEHLAKDNILELQKREPQFK